MNKLITTKELCSWLGIGKTTANKWRRMGLPYIQNGSHSIRYDKNEVTTWMQTQNIATSIPVDKTFHDDINKSLKDAVETMMKYNQMSNKDFLLKTLENKDIENTEKTIDELTNKIKGFMMHGTGQVVDRIMLMETVMNKYFEVFNKYKFYNKLNFDNFQLFFSEPLSC